MKKTLIALLIVLCLVGCAKDGDVRITENSVTGEVNVEMYVKNKVSAHPWWWLGKSYWDTYDHRAFPPICVRAYGIDYPDPPWFPWTVDSACKWRDEWYAFRDKKKAELKRIKEAWEEVDCVNNTSE